MPEQLIRAALDLELLEGTVIADQVGETSCALSAGLHRAERTIAERLTRLANGTLPWPWIDPTRPSLGSRSTSASPLPKAKSRQSGLR